MLIWALIAAFFTLNILIYIKYKINEMDKHILKINTELSKKLTQHKVQDDRLHDETKMQLNIILDSMHVFKEVKFNVDDLLMRVEKLEAKKNVKKIEQKLNNTI